MDQLANQLTPTQTFLRPEISFVRNLDKALMSFLRM
jgi:hypothetical protein